MVLRRAEIPLVYSEGFSPRPKIAFGLALPTGAESECEYLDSHLDDQNMRLQYYQYQKS